jgi:hypothetical protein
VHLSERKAAARGSAEKCAGVLGLRENLSKGAGRRVDRVSSALTLS